MSYHFYITCDGEIHRGRHILIKKRQAPSYSPTFAVPSALPGFITLFGMGRDRSTVVISTFDKINQLVA